MAKHAAPQPVVPISRTTMVAPVVAMPAAVYIERLRTWAQAPLGRHARV